jgi:hypothetical protein
MAKKSNNPKTARAATKTARAAPKTAGVPTKTARAASRRITRAALAAATTQNVMKILVPQISETPQFDGSAIVTVPVAFSPAISEQNGVLTAGCPTIGSRMMNTTIADPTQDLTPNGTPNLPPGGTASTRTGTVTFNVPATWMGQTCVIEVYLLDSNGNVLASDCWTITP